MRQPASSAVATVVEGEGRNRPVRVVAALLRPLYDPGMPARRVVVLAFAGCQSLDVTGPFEVFAGANRWAAAFSARWKPPTPVTATCLLA